jgi:hypothetical protein
MLRGSGRRQAALLRGAEEEREALDRIDAIADTGMEIRADTGMEVRADSGMEVRADTGMEIRADTGMEAGADTGMEADAGTGDVAGGAAISLRFWSAVATANRGRLWLFSRITLLKPMAC